MKLLVDTDVLIDVALDRRPHAEHSGRLLEYLERNPGSGWIAWHSVANFYYLVSTRRNEKMTRDLIVELTTFLSFPSTNTEHLQFALNLQLRDLEDAMLVAAGSSAGVDIIATRNLRDYVRSPIPADSPKSLMKALR